MKPTLKKKPQGPQTLAQKFAHWKELVAKLERIIPTDHPFSAFPEIERKGMEALLDTMSKTLTKQIQIYQKMFPPVPDRGSIGDKENYDR